MTGAAAAPVHSFCLHSCVHRVASLQSWAEERPQARWRKLVLSACPRLDLVMPKMGQPGPGRRETRVPAADLGLVWGITAGRREAVCNLPHTPTMGNQQQRQQQAVWQMQGPVECSPCSRPPCPALPCLAACSPRCRRSSPPWKTDPVPLWCCWWSPGRTDASWGYTASTSSSARTCKPHIEVLGRQQYATVIEFRRKRAHDFPASRWQWRVSYFFPEWQQNLHGVANNNRMILNSPNFHSSKTRKSYGRFKSSKTG